MVTNVFSDCVYGRLWWIGVADEEVTLSSICLECEKGVRNAAICQNVVRRLPKRRAVTTTMLCGAAPPETLWLPKRCVRTTKTACGSTKTACGSTNMACGCYQNGVQWLPNHCGVTYAEGLSVTAGTLWGYSWTPWSHISILLQTPLYS